MGTKGKGYTLLEVLFVLFIISVSTLLVMPSVSSMMESIKGRSSAIKVASLLNYARVSAIREKKAYYAKAEPGRVVLSAQGAQDKEIKIPEGLSVEARDKKTIVFFPSGGSSGGAFDIRSGKGAAPYKIEVGLSGLVRINS